VAFNWRTGLALKAVSKHLRGQMVYGRDNVMEVASPEVLKNPFIGY